MVRVFKCHRFKSATVVPVADEPLTVWAEGGLVFVATRQCTIRVFKQNDGDEGYSEWRCISTISMVEKMAYNKTKDYILTQEQKKSWKSVSLYVRLYLNWDLEPQKAMKLRTKVRVAGKSHTLHSTKDYAPQLEVVDMPLDGGVTAIDVCRATGNFAVAFGREVKLYQVVEKTVANSDKTYKDVEPFLELCWNFEVLSASLSEEFLVCCSANQVQAVAITYAETDDASPRLGRVKSPVAFDNTSTASSRGRDEMSPAMQGQRLMFAVDDVPDELPARDATRRDSPSVVSVDHSVASVASITNSTCTQASLVFTANSPRPIVDDEYYQEWSFEPDDTLSEEGGDSSKTSSRIIYLESLHQGSAHPQRGAAPPVLRDFRGGPVKSSSGVSAKTVLHIGDMKEQDDWQSVTLIPAYVPEDDGLSRAALSSAWSSPVRSALLQNRCSVCCYVSSGRGGYLYRLHPGGVSLVSTYRYSDNAYSVTPGPHLLHVVTKTGLETYTARWGAVALAVTEGAEGEEEVRPSSSLDICMCGIEPFFGAVDISHGGNIIALLTKIEAQKSQEDSQWNLYVLQNCSAVEQYTDMCHFASRIQETGPSSYHHLLQEAHLMLRWELCRHLNSDPDLVDLYQESCALLAEYYSWPRQEDWHLCLPYYKKSGLTLSDVVRQAVQNKQHTREQSPVYVYGKGLMQYLDWVLFQSDVDLKLREDLSNTVMQIYSQTAPESLPALILLSRLELYSPETALHLLSDLTSLKEARGEQSSTVDRLATVKIHLLLCDPESAEMVLSSLDKTELVEVCTKHPDLIHSGVSGFTPLGQLMRRHTPSTLLHLLADIVSQGNMLLDTCVLLLEQNCDVTRYKNNQVKEFLEVLLCDVKRKLWFEEAASQLCEIYVQRLMLGVECQPVKHNRPRPCKFHLPSGNGHFASRFPWLDYLPPVTSPANLKASCQHVSMAMPGIHGHRTTSMAVPSRGERAGGDGGGGGGEKEGREPVCTCAFCIQDLLKLQSLLCSKYASSDLRSYVLRLISDRQDLLGWDSVWMLCSYDQNAKDVTEFAVDKYPQILAKFAVTAFGRDLEKWRLVLGCVETRLKEQTSRAPNMELASSPQHKAFLSAYKDVLEELVELVPAEDFLMSLPAEGSVWFLLPFLTRCLQRKHLDELKATIAEKGRALTTHLNPS